MRLLPSSSALRVEAACCDEVPPLLARHGDTWCRRPGDDHPPVLCAVAGALRQHAAPTNGLHTSHGLHTCARPPARATATTLGTGVTTRCPALATREKHEACAAAYAGALSDTGEEVVALLEQGTAPARGELVGVRASPHFNARLGPKPNPELNPDPKCQPHFQHQP